MSGGQYSVPRGGTPYGMLYVIETSDWKLDPLVAFLYLQTGFDRLTRYFSYQVIGGLGKGEGAAASSAAEFHDHPSDPCACELRCGEAVYL